ncbi:MAG: hypothetical protein HY000_21160 [Planctomycetes bacterium]|nr:hypothetical protein [Planctomycetota bacterium]
MSRLVARRNVRHFIRAGVPLAIAAMVGVTGVLAPLTARGESPMNASTSRAAREEALQSIPFDKLPESHKTKISDVLDKVSIYRRLPVQVCHCDPQLYLFLMDHPEVLVNIWQAMGITGMSLHRTGPDAYKIDDGAGTQSDLEILYHDQNTHLVYAEGIYNGPVLKRPVKGRCVVLLKSGYSQKEDGAEFVTHRIDAFVHLDRVGAELVAKTFQPLVGKSADENFSEATAFLTRLSQAAEQNQAGVQRLGQYLTKIDPVLQQQFIMLTASIADKAVARTASAPDSSAQRR